MNKATSRTLAVLLASIMMATTAQAATLYNKDGLKYDIKGDLQIQLRQDPGADMQPDVEYDDLEVKNKVTYQIDENLTAFTGLDFAFNKAADDSTKNPNLEEAYVGLGYGDYRVSLGKTTNASDSFGIEMSIEEMIEDAFNKAGVEESDDLIKFEGKIGNVKVIAAHEFAGKSKEMSSTLGGRYTDIFVGTTIAGVELGAAYQNYEAYRGLSTKGQPTFEDAVNIYGISAAYDAKVVKIAADYSVAEDNQTITNIAASLPVGESVKVAAGYVSQDFDDSAVEDITGWYANITRNLNKNVNVFAEIQDTDAKDIDMGYLAGMQVKF